MISFALLLALAAAAAAVPVVDLRNQVSACLNLDKQQVLRSGSFARLSAEGTFLQHTGECGCTSALLEYVVSSGDAEKRIEWVRALVSARPPTNGGQKRFEFILQADSALRLASPLRIDLHCAPHK